MFGNVTRAVRASINDATRAVSIHNSQPWRFVVHGSSVQVWLDASRGPRIVDPVGRWAVQSVGAAIANLELAIALRLNARVSVEEFPQAPAVNGRALPWPEAGEQVPPALRELAASPIAVVHWSGEGDAHDASDPSEAMFAAIDHRFTSRAPFAPATVPQRQWRILRAAGTVGEVVTEPAPLAFAEFYLALTARIGATQVDDPAYLAELQQWVDRSRFDGIPSGSAGSHDRLGHFPGRDFSLGTTHVSTTLVDADFEIVPQLAVLHSTHDGPIEWLHAGMALQQLALRATSLGLRIGILGQVIEDDEARELAAQEFSTVAGLPGTTRLHQVVRVGYGDGTPRPAATPRRPLAEVLIPEERV